MWSCDPMHGNTIVSGVGRKTRPFGRIVNEVEAFFQIHRAEGTYAGGVHLEMTGQDVTECVGGAQEIRDEHLSSSRYITALRPTPQCEPGSGTRIPDGGESARRTFEGRARRRFRMNVA